MKIVNRGYMLVVPKQPFLDWAKENDDEMDGFVSQEPNIYLIEEEFYDEEPILLSNFKKIFLNELLTITDNQNNYPAINEGTFKEWFDVSFGTMVFDTIKTDLKAD